MKMIQSDERQLAVIVRGLTRTFGSKQILKNIDLDMIEGESVVLLGPNGAGKTTFLKILATIIAPSSGSVNICGYDIKKNAEEARRNIGIVSHNTFLYGNLTAYENLDFYCRMYDVMDRKTRIQQMAEMMGMSSRLDARAHTLSRGMQQRISIARALLHKPQFVLLDEPDTGLDKQALNLLREALSSYSEKRPTVLMTTHNLERGLDMADRVLIMNKGTFVFDGHKGSLDNSSLERLYRERTGAEL